MAQSFQRIRDLVRKHRLREQQQNENNSKLEQIVREVMARHAEEEAMKAAELKKSQLPRDKRSYQEAMNRPISIISYDIPEYQVWWFVLEFYYTKCLKVFLKLKCCVQLCSSLLLYPLVGLFTFFIILQLFFYSVASLLFHQNSQQKVESFIPSFHSPLFFSNFYKFSILSSIFFFIYYLFY